MSRVIEGVCFEVEGWYFYRIEGWYPLPNYGVNADKRFRMPNDCKFYFEHYYPNAK